MLAAAGLLTALVPTANATLSWSTPLTINSPNIVGTANGVTADGQGSPTFELDVAQALFNLGPSQDVFVTVDGAASTELVTSSTSYSGTVNTSTYTTGGAGQEVGAGWDYAIAKYDGQNAGYILFYLGGQAADLPQSPADFWTTQSGQYGISGWTAFDATTVSPVPEASTYFAAALLLLPLGIKTLRTLRQN